MSPAGRLPAGTVQRVRRGERAPRAERGPGSSDFFATTLPGLGRLLLAEISANPDLTPDEDIGNDGRSDIAFFRTRRGAALSLRDLRLAEDVFTMLARSRGGPPRTVANSLVNRTDLERSLSVWARFGRRLTSSMGFRVIARVVDEGRFKRTELRAALTKAVAANRPRWRVEDPAQLELWALEYDRATFVSGLRLSDKQLRQHGSGRVTERQGALRPVVAAAMVRLAGAVPGRLLDPCCGSGTILDEALATGWEATGSDIDPEAVAAARDNVPRASVHTADVRHLPHDDDMFDAVVSNLPFGRQFEVEDPARWLSQTLAEMARVTRPGGRIVVLVPPPVPHPLRGFNLAATHSLRLLGVSTRIWVFESIAESQDHGAPDRDAASNP
ncbi:MAG: TRM11 family SAM-dependent methyltransferase [Pseudonocardiales bacterium]